MQKFKTNIFNELEAPTIVLSTKYHKHLGTIDNIDKDSINCIFNMASAQEISFDVYKELNGKLCNLWDSIVDLKYIYVPQYKEYYEISCKLDESEKTVKHIVGKSACESELSQRLIRNFECNTESDILRDDYVVTIFYNSENENASLLHRILKDKCPDYSIKHVDSSLANIQRSFSVDNTSIYDFLTGELAEEIGCLFTFDSANRTISVYDLKCSCKHCGYRGEFSGNCPTCDSTDIDYGYGENTNIFISTENFADSITVEGDSGSVKNCLKIEGGDELMTATVANINPSSSEYIYCISNDMKADMPTELVEKLESYDDLYNSLLPQYEEYTEKMYENIDKEIYLTSGMMPTVTLPETNALQELSNLEATLQSQTVSVQNINNISKTSADLAVNGIAKVIVDSRYTTEILSSALSDLIYIDDSQSIIDSVYRIWIGKLKVTNKGIDDDFAESLSDISVKLVGDDYEQYLYQKIQKSLNKDDGLFTSVFEIDNIDDFKLALKEYCLDSLKSFESSYQTCIEVLIENGVTDKNSTFYDVDLYNTMYVPYYDRILAIQEEIIIRELDIEIVKDDKQSYQALREDIQEQLDFKNYLGEDLWLIFCSYIREDTYSNGNYISDGLSNSELIKSAKELFELANEEIHKSSELQITLTNTLENLISTKEFKGFKDYIDIGNWITNKVDDVLYRLRLISIEINFGNTDKISVSFSNVKKVKDIISDTKSILEQAKSMASSFNYVEHQANQGKEANDVIDDYRKVGLDTALYNIVNSDTQDVKYDEHGISCRKYDDVLDDYLPEQLRIINNTIAFTSDNWKTVSAALGKLKYIIDGIEYENYGLNADHVITGVIVGGDIYSGNYSSTNKTGMHIGLNDCVVSIGGDALTYNIKDGLSVNGSIVATSGKIGDWNINKALYSGTNSMTSVIPGVYIGIDGYRNYKDENNYLQIKDGVITAKGGTFTGIINAENGTFTGVVNAKGGTFSDTITCSGTISGGTITGATIVSNDATIQGGKIGCWEINANSLYNGIAYTGTKDSNSTGMGTYGTDWAFWAGNGKFSVKQNGSMYANDATIEGSITATSGVFDNVTIKDTCTVAGQSITGVIGSNATWNGSAIQNNYIGNLNAGKLTSGTVGVGYSYGTTSISASGITSESALDVFNTIQVVGGIRATYNTSSGSSGTIGTSSLPFQAMYATSFLNGSSENTKTNIQKKNVSDCLDIVLNTEVVSYNYKNDFFDKSEVISDLNNKKSKFIESVGTLSRTGNSSVSEGDEEYNRCIEVFDSEIANIESLNSDSPKLKHGFISENVPDELASEDKKAVDLYSSIAMAYGAIQELNKKIESLELKIQELQKGDK